MALEKYNIALGAIEDENGKNYISGKAVYIRNKDTNALIDIYQDQAGNMQIPQNGVNNVSDNVGMFSFWVEAGRYKAVIDAIDYYISVLGIEYFQNEADAAVAQAVANFQPAFDDFLDDSQSTFDSYMASLAIAGQQEVDQLVADLTASGNAQFAAAISAFNDSGNAAITNFNNEKNSALSNFNTEGDTAIGFLKTSQGFHDVGTFAAGFVYEKFNDVGRDDNGNPWVYIGDETSYPVTVAAGTDPSAFPSLYAQRGYNDHAALANRNQADAHDSDAITNTDGLTAQDTHDATKAILIAQGLSGNFGFFEKGFTYNEVGDVGIDSDGGMWTYSGSDSLPVSVPAGTVPSEGEYHEVASGDMTLQDFARSFELPDTPAMEINPNLSVNRLGATARRKFASSESLEIYVDASVIASGDGSALSPFKTFREALEEVPINLYHKVRIYIMDGVYNEPFVMDRIYSTASRFGNFEIIGHTPDNPRYSDTSPESVVFYYLVDGYRIEATLSNVIGGQYNTKLKGIQVQAFWPYNASLEISDCVVVGGGGAFAPSEGYGVGGHGGSILFTRVKFKDIGGLVAEASDFARFHFDNCEVENWLGGANGLLAVNGSVISIEESPDLEALGWLVEPGSMIYGDGGLGIRKNIVQTNNSSNGLPAQPLYLAAGSFTNTSATYSSVLELRNKDELSNPAGCNLYIGSTEEVKNSRFDVFWSDGSGGVSSHKRIASLNINGDLSLSGSVGFNGSTPLKPNITGATDSEKLSSLILALSQIGMIVDSTT